MRTAVGELTLQAAQRILDNARAGRVYDPHTVAWAGQIVRANAPAPADDEAAPPVAA